jgi:hypothetical protein
MENSKNKIYWSDAVKFIKEGKPILNEIDFGNEKINWEIVKMFNKLKISVPEELIDYDDENIDYSDLPPIEQLLADGSFKEVFTVSFEQDIAKWLKESNINYNLLINDFLKTVYQSVKAVNQQGYVIQP